MSTDIIAVLVTFPSQAAATAAATTLVEERLAACVNLFPEARSIYRWEDKVQDESETMAIIKTASARFEQLRARVVELHPYDCPEVLAIPVLAGHLPYLEWVASSTAR